MTMFRTEAKLHLGRPDYDAVGRAYTKKSSGFVRH